MELEIPLGKEGGCTSSRDTVALPAFVGFSELQQHVVQGGRIFPLRVAHMQPNHGRMRTRYIHYLRLSANTQLPDCVYVSMWWMISSATLVHSWVNTAIRHSLGQGSMLLWEVLDASS